MQRDVLIVGFGLAGWALTQELRKNDISYVVFDSQIKSSSKSATGIYNPVVLKRFRAIWNAKTLMEYAIPFYTQPIFANVVHHMPIHRVLASVSEQNDWTIASDKLVLNQYLNPEIFPNSNPNVHAPFGLGVLEHTGWIDTNRLLLISQKELEQQKCFVAESFDYTALDVSNKEIHYKNFKVNHVVFAEGVGVLKNPWFSKLPIIPNKGEWIVIFCEGLQLHQIIKGSIFIVPLGNDVYRVGATYAREFVDSLPTAEGRKWLTTQLMKLLKLPFEVIEHGAALRPTVSDRKPVTGQHPAHGNLWCLNGLGSRGVLLAPYLAKLLTAALCGSTVPKEVHLGRFFTKQY